MSLENNSKIVNKLYKVGDKIHINEMVGEPQYSGKEGEIVYIDSIGQIHGSWGGCALIYGEDNFFKIIDESK